MKRIPWIGALLCVFCLFPAVPLFAARPLFTEDTETVEKRSFEMELGFDFFRENNRDKDYLHAIQLKYGLLDKMEIGGSLGYLWSDVHEGGNLDGWTDLFAYLKYRLWEGGEHYPAFALKPLLILPTQTWRGNTESRRVDYALGGIFDKSFGKVTLFFDIFYYWIGDPAENDVLNTGAALEYKFLEGWSAVGEVRYLDNFNSDRKDDPLFFNFGLKKEVGWAVLDAAVNVGLNKAAPDYGFTVGLTIPFK
ncbi:MAG: transporter [Planctomycetaceae bacterium]